MSEIEDVLVEIPCYYCLKKHILPASEVQKARAKIFCNHTCKNKYNRLKRTLMPINSREELILHNESIVIVKKFIKRCWR